MANTYLYKAQPGVGSSIKSTFSGWIKLANDNLTGGIYGQYYSANYLFDICLQNGHLEVADYLVNQYKMRKRTTQKLRDLNAWYHIYVAIDRSLGTAADRTKVYINGERVTDFQSSEDTNYTQQTSGSHDGNCMMNDLGDSSDFSRVGIRYDGNEFDGSMSHIYWVDGSVIDISEFGSTDSTTGEWKINTNPTISSYGQIGFLCLKDGNTITDQSPNSNNFTSSGTGVTKTEDCPSNVFATYNPLNNTGVTLTKGNLTGAYSTNDANIRSTLGVSTGKWYWETKFTTGSGCVVGVCNEDVTQATNRANSAGFYGIQNANTTYAYYRQNGSTGETSGYPNPVQGNIVNVALDLDNSKMYIGINGVYKNQAGTTSDIANGTNPFFSGIASSVWFPILEYRGSATTDSNFGNGYFGTTVVSSAGTNASNNGIFEYDVPTGFTALSTKGLNL